ncbi:hypothetical protein JXB02_04950 [Candidatus Woesearchaeota archaeon]|nr:hypothetical protein [Candidatus Woesearchaeota archaeon]
MGARNRKGTRERMREGRARGRPLAGTKHGQVWVSAILYMLIAAIAIILILDAGLPLLNMMRDKSTYAKAQDTMIGLNKHIEDIAGEGIGSQRVVSVEIEDGELYVEGGRLTWELETESKILEPRTKIRMGNLVISSNVDVNSYEHGSHYILENSRIRVRLNRFGNQSINLSDIVEWIFLKETNASVNGTFDFAIGDPSDPANSEGVVTSAMFPATNQTNADYVSVIYSVDSANFDYDLEITLESQADFLSIRAKDIT